MMKYRGALLALAVLGIATILMVFFVLPRMSGDGIARKEATAPISTEAQKTAETKPAAPAAPDPQAVTAAAHAKLVRLKQTADSAVGKLVALFADSKLPGADAFGDGRAVSQAALEGLSAIDLPKDIDPSVAESILKARTGAGRALSLLKVLPTDPRSAAPFIPNIARALNGEELLPIAEAKPAVQSGVGAAKPADDPLVPKFDVLRVEPDGWTVIAGNTIPGAKVDIVDGESKVIASAKAGPSGDFAAALDVPLPPGDHALALRATDGKGNSAVSAEVATVSVPHKGNGQLLAMITKPGEASRVITMPEPQQPKVQPAPLPAPQPAMQQQAAPEPAAPAPLVTPPLPAGSDAITAAAPAIPAPAVPAPASPAPAATAAVEMAAAPPAAAALEARPAASVQVTAVELEGDRIFVAGTATPGNRVQAFADDQPIGETQVDATSRFVVEGKIALAIGDHTIRADLLDSLGKLVMRATVPFNRPPGEQVAAVAPSAETPPAGGQMVPLDQGAFDKQRDALARAFAILQGLYGDGRRPTLDQLAAARSATEIALKSLAEFRAAAGTPAEAVERIGLTAANAGDALKFLQALSREVEPVGTALPRLAALIQRVLDGAEPVAPAAQASAAPAEPTPAETAKAEPAATEPAAPKSAPPIETAQQPATIQQAPLTASANSVIIRQGDTLWQISRRVYGQGVRYTTIYLANEDRIADPDRIAPGQVFRVPESALPNAEDLHRRRLRGEKID